jgi:hypothetical protein
MAKNSPSLDDWRRLYEASIGIKALAPWEWMTEDMVFGVQSPETDQPGFVSMMGMLGEHFAAAVYLGARALYEFWSVESEAEGSYPERILEIPQLQASWEDRNTLRQEDRAIIKELGLKFRGRNEWPMFRSYHPGYAPWFLEAEEARFLANVLEQALDVLSRFDEDRSLLQPQDDESYLVRVPHRQGASVIWEDRIVRVPPPAPTPVRMMMNVELLEALKSRPQGTYSLEVDFFMFPGPFRDRGDRPYFAYELLTVEAQSSFIVGHELLHVETTLEDLWGTTPFHLVNHFASFGAVPRQVRVRTMLLEQLLQPLAEELGFRLRRSKTLRSLDEVKQFMLARFM